ncbi:MAG: DUF5606 domain-containing protein [Tannerellaceae bacterium]|jgi:hypothetical protein|nr:DUF5606 domain-containing protein [Tannerellaceae bacterium]
MLKTILYVAGKSGLFKRVSQGKNMLIVESLVDKRRIPLYAKERILTLSKITFYTTGEGEVPLHEIFTKIQNKEGGEKVNIDLAAESDDLRAYMAEILPDFDRKKVYPSDIRKVLSWYNLLVSSGITDFTPDDKPEEALPEGSE